SLRYPYDSNDVFRVAGVQVTLSQFQAALNPQIDGTGSTVSIRFNPDPAGISEFNVCKTAGADAPSNLTAAGGNFDNGSTADDVRGSCTAPTNNQVTCYNIQRATVSSPANGTNSSPGATPPNAAT